MTVQPTMGQPSYQPAPEYGHPMMGQLGPIGGQFTTPYVFAGRSMGPMMSIPGNPRDPRMAMNKQPSELSLGLGEPISIPNTTLAANVEPVLKDRSVEDGKLFLLRFCYSPMASMLMLCFFVDTFFFLCSPIQ